MEKSLLATLILDPNSIGDAIDSLSYQEFYLDRHKKIFQAMGRLVRAGSPLDVVTIAQYLMEIGEIEAAGGAGYLSDLLDIPLVADVSYYINKIKETAALRKAIEICNATIKRCYRDGHDAVSVLDYLQSSANSITVDTSRQDLFKLTDLLDISMSRYRELAEHPEEVRGFHTGFGMIDFMMSGLTVGLTVLAARPSMGKTTLATNIVINGAKRGDGAIIFSLEQGEDELADRIVASTAMVNLQRFRTGKFDEGDWEKIAIANERLRNMPVYIDPTPALTVSEIRRRTRQYIRKDPAIKLVVIDYLQLLTGKKAENRNHEIGEITRQLKGLSKECNVALLLLSQLNRELEKRPNPAKRPRLSDLRDSGNIEQDADNILFIYRPDVYNDHGTDNEPTFPDQADIMISKQRNGPTGIVTTRFVPRHTRFYEIEDWEKGDQHGSK